MEQENELNIHKIWDVGKIHHTSVDNSWKIPKKCGWLSTFEKMWILGRDKKIYSSPLLCIC